MGSTLGSGLSLLAAVHVAVQGIVDLGQGLSAGAPAIAAVADPEPVGATGAPLAEHVLRAAGGLGVFLLGMTFMTDGLKQLAGRALRDLLARFTRGPLRAFVTGFGVTVAMQASSSTVLTTMAFAAAGLVTLIQAVGIVAGATVGSSSTSWLIATLGLRANFALWLAPLLLVGALLRLLGRGAMTQVGLLVAGFGMILVGIGTLRGSVGPLVDVIDIDAIQSSGLAGILTFVGIGIVLSTLMQSSAGAIAVAMASLADGSLSFAQATPLVIGASVGTTSTAFLVMPGVRSAARRVAGVWIFVSLLSAVLAIALLPLLRSEAALLAPLFAFDGGSAERSPTALALFHTSFSLIGAIVSLALAKPIANIFNRLMPSRGPQLTQHLDAVVGGVPAVSLEAARRTVRATACVAIGEATRELADGAPADRQRLEDVKQAESEVGSFLESVRRESLAGADAERLVAVLQALDHVKDIRRLVRRGLLRPSGPEVPGLISIRRRLDEASGQVSGWLSESGDGSPDAEISALSRAIGGERGELRAEILRLTSSGEIPAARADSELDSLRALDEYGRDLARLVSNLSLFRPIEADTEAAEP
jgi:phosphate:Na+ symporter